ncbi:hypothetical protein RvY_14946 [Ramazzottius varieornatus]|uniref:Uncharacterized protein n=1 Tax=Ramazzottius varieornatus TaxID=947166 RepID=A0A1D1VUK7_RAMVA|nr:hypothetical protein RvY_14946 [Ramazzottius varieornatus]
MADVMSGKLKDDVIATILAVTVTVTYIRTAYAVQDCIWLPLINQAEAFLRKSLSDEEQLSSLYENGPVC